MKYAVQVRLDGDWLYVTHGSGTDLQPVTFDNSEDAEEYADYWRLTGKESFVRVVTYKAPSDYTEMKRWVE